MLFRDFNSKSKPVCLLQAVAEEPPGLRSKKGKEEKSKGKAKVRGGLQGVLAAPEGAAAITPVFSLPQSTPAAADSEGEEEEDTAKEKGHPQQGKDRDKKEAEQVCAHAGPGQGRHSGDK